MVNIAETISNLATLALLGGIAVVLLQFRQPLSDASQGASEAVSMAYQSAQDYDPGGGDFEVGSGGQSSGGPRRENAELNNDITNAVDSTFGWAGVNWAPSGYVERDGETVYVTTFGERFDNIDTLTPGDRFGDEQYTGTGF